MRNNHYTTGHTTVEQRFDYRRQSVSSPPHPDRRCHSAMGLNNLFNLAPEVKKNRSCTSTRRPRSTARSSARLLSSLLNGTIM